MNRIRRIRRIRRIDRIRLLPVALVVCLAAAALVVAFAGARPARAYPNKQKLCTSCHSGSPSGSVTAVPDTASPSAGATYNVAITNTLTAAGNSGYWIAQSDAAGTTGASTGVYAGPGSATSWNAAMTAPSAPGTYYYKVWSVTGPADNTGMAKAATYSITVAGAPPAADTTAPTTAAGGATNGAWYHLPVTLTLTATDNAGGSGVKSIVYTVDGGAPQTVNGATTQVLLPVDAVTHADDGAHTIAYHALDNQDNAETPHDLTVNVDTVKPTTSAPTAAKVKVGAKATLAFQIADAAPNGGSATVTIKIKNSAGKVVKTIKAGSKPVNAPSSASFTCKMAKGTYKFSVLATDTAGNTQANIAVNKLVVK